MWINERDFFTVCVFKTRHFLLSHVWVRETPLYADIAVTFSLCTVCNNCSFSSPSPGKGGVVRGGRGHRSILSALGGGGGEEGRGEGDTGELEEGEGEGGKDVSSLSMATSGSGKV